MLSSWVVPNEKLGILEEPGKTQKTLIDKRMYDLAIVLRPPFPIYSSNPSL
jgi:hypothetical protein